MKNPALIARFAGIILLLVIMQIAIAPLVAIGNVQPDFILLGIVFIAVRYGSLPAMFYAFSAGLLFDLFIGDVIGLTALAKTIAAFLAGFFYKEEKAESAGKSPIFIGTIAISSLANNLVFVIGYFRDIMADIARIFVLQVAGTLLYTVVLSIVPVLILAARQRKVKV